MPILAPDLDTVSGIRAARLVSVVDDDESVRDSLAALLRSVGYRVRTFASAEELLDSDALEETATLILDMRMPGMDGLQLQARLNQRGSQVPVIFVSAHMDGPMRQRAMAAGAVDLLRKPFTAGGLLSAVEVALEFRGAQPGSPPVRSLVEGTT